MSFTKFYYIKEDFQLKDMERVVSIIKSYLEKKLGMKLYQIPGIDYYKNSKDSGEGLRYILPDNKQIRFNFDGGSIVSIDIWKPNEKDPSVQIDTRNISIIKILPFIVDQINKPKVGTYEVDLEKQSEISDVITSEAVQVKIGEKIYPSQKSAIEDLLKAGKTTKEIMQLTNAKASLISTVKKELGMIVNVRVYEAGKNEINNNPDLPYLQKEFDNTKYADIKYIFEDLEALVDLIARGQSYSLLITGAAGSGKSMTTLEVLNRYGKQNDFYMLIKGITSPFGLYTILYEYNGKIIVFDDCDDVLENKDSISILKAALDNKKEREISWRTKMTFDPKGMPQEQIDALVMDGKLPNNFNFSGRIIFITNKIASSLDKALLSRSIHIDVTLKRQDILTRIRQILDKIAPEIDRKYKEELIDFYEKNLDKIKKDIDIRKFDHALKIIASGKPNWERLVINYV